jgi:hypothetical protein
MIDSPYIGQRVVVINNLNQQRSGDARSDLHIGSCGTIFHIWSGSSSPRVKIQFDDGFQWSLYTDCIGALTTQIEVLE